MKKLVFAGAVCVAAIALAACAPASSSAPESVEYPTAGKTIQVIVPFTAGGTTDVTARAFATVLADSLDANVEVINTPGAGGQIGLTALAAAAPDGYTLGFTNLPSTIPTYLVEDRGATYDRASFVPIGGLARTTNYLAVSAASSYQSVQELLDAAKAAPGVITIGVAGDDEKLGVEAAAASAGVTFNIVPFDGGSEKTTALLGNQVEAIVGGGTTIIPGVKNGDFRALGIFGGTPDPFLPDLPTFKSLGIDLDINGYLVLSAPAGVPDSVVTTIQEAVKASTADPKYQETVTAGFQDPFFVSGADIAKIWQTQEEMFSAQLSGA